MCGKRLAQTWHIAGAQEIEAVYHDSGCLYFYLKEYDGLFPGPSHLPRTGLG